MSARLVSTFSLVLIYSWMVGPLMAENEVLSSITQEVQTVFTNAKTSVVKIRSNDKHGRCVGSGFFIDPNGTLYTTYAVGGESNDIVVESGDKKFPATRLVADLRSGIAILKVAASTPFIPIGSSHALEVASPVITVGYPMDLPLTPTVGFIGGFDLKYLNRFFTTTHIRANLPVQRGLSGAPLLNTAGEAVGILISGIDGGSACYALPIEAAEKIRHDFIRFGEVRHGWIGITVTRNPENSAGPWIDTFSDTSPATQSGLKKGDTLVRIGDIPIKNPEDVLNGSFFLTSGEEIDVEVLRNGQREVFSITPAVHPKSQKMHTATLESSPLLGDSLQLGSPR